MWTCKWIHTLLNRRALNQRLSRPASSPVPQKPPNLKQKTTVPPGEFRFVAGAPNACLHAALADNIAGGKTSEEPNQSQPKSKPNRSKMKQNPVKAMPNPIKIILKQTESMSRGAPTNPIIVFKPSTSHVLGTS